MAQVIKFDYIKYKGKTQSIADWSRELNIIASTIRKRLSRGWTVERALETRRN